MPWSARAMKLLPLTRIYGGAAKCHRVEGSDGERVGQARSVDVTHVRVRGTRATATVTLHGGSRDGARGAVALVHRPAGWRVSDLSAGLVRSQFEVGIRQMQSLDPGVKACITKKMRKVSDAEFKRLAFHAETVGQRRLAAVSQRCHALSAAAARMALQLAPGCCGRNVRRRSGGLQQRIASAE